jgi:hypothetical protein
MVRIILAVAALASIPSAVAAQQPRAYAGGSVNVITQTHADDQPLGGTALGGSALFGVRVSSRVSIEFEPSFGEQYSSEYTYRPALSLSATVVASRRDRFFPVQARFGLGVLEPVIGVGVAHGTTARHATFSNGVTYFDDARAENDLALVGGLDAAVKLASRFYLMPSFRMLAVSRAAQVDPLGEQTSTGTFTFRYGVGARVTF